MELVLVIAIITAIAGITIPVNQRLHIKNALDMMVITLSQTIRNAQLLSREGAGDAGWSVKITSGNIVLYKGDNYGARDANFDQVTNFPTTIVTTGLDELHFTKYAGNPHTSGTINLQIKPYEQNITINEKGTVSY